MAISKRARVTLVSGGIVALAAYLVVVDLGLSAGRIHRGVSVQGIGIGGLTVLEANKKLAPIAAELASSDFVLTAPGDDCRFRPRQLGWGLQPFDTAEHALEVGRRDAPFGALWDRARAWLNGVKIDWAVDPDPARVNSFIESCSARFEPLGIEVDAEALRELLYSVIGTRPHQQVYTLPTL